jgi:hypothetical protein
MIGELAAPPEQRRTYQAADGSPGAVVDRDDRVHAAAILSSGFATSMKTTESLVPVGISAVAKSAAHRSFNSSMGYALWVRLR